MVGVVSRQPCVCRGDFVAEAIGVHDLQSVDGPGRGHCSCGCVGHASVGETAVRGASADQLLQGCADPRVVDRHVKAVAMSQCGEDLGAVGDRLAVRSRLVGNRAVAGDHVDELVDLALEDLALLAGLFFSLRRDHGRADGEQTDGAKESWHHGGWGKT